VRRRRRNLSLEAGPTAAVLAAIVGADLGATVAVAVLLKRLVGLLSHPVGRVSELAESLVEHT
jgi:hypothetical protein